MLVLTRQQGEQIPIGSEILITVVRTKGKTVRLGIQAPAHVAVLRGEIAVAIAEDEQQKAGGDEHDEDPWPAHVESACGRLQPLAAARSAD